MATRKNTPNHKGDADRLFAVAIIEYLGAFSTLPESTRRELMLALPEGRGHFRALTQAKGADPILARWIRNALSELEAWETIERIRTWARND